MELKSMSSEDFFKEENKNLRDCIKVLEQHCGSIELVSYCLAPNVNGFCYEIVENPIGAIEIRSIENALDSLSVDQENVIKELYL